jgi:hypothetical protein
MAARGVEKAAAQCQGHDWQRVLVRWNPMLPHRTSVTIFIFRLDSEVHGVLRLIVHCEMRVFPDFPGKW